jgi:thioredoxin reductase (NADPH)
VIGTANEPYDVLVVGGGMTGLSAACHAATLGATVACAEPALFGGLVASVGEIDDFPPASTLSGAALADAYHQRAGALGVTFLAAEVASLSRVDDRIRAESIPQSVLARTAIIASGARLRSLGVPNEHRFHKRGLSDCAWCDGGLYRGKAVAVVGDGDSALQAALHLARQCSRVSLVAPGAFLRAKRRYLLLAAEEPRIEFLWETRAESFVGEEHVEGLRLRSLADDTTIELACECVFVYVGLEPTYPSVTGGVALDPSGYIATDDQMRTSVPGIYAAGAVRSGYGGSIANALSDGELAATTAFRSLEASSG